MTWQGHGHEKIGHGDRQALLKLSAASNSLPVAVACARAVLTHRPNGHLPGGPTSISTGVGSGGGARGGMCPPPTFLIGGGNSMFVPPHF